MYHIVVSMAACPSLKHLSLESGERGDRIMESALAQGCGGSDVSDQSFPDSVSSAADFLSRKYTGSVGFSEGNRWRV